MTNVSLPKATFVKLKPQHVDFLEISNPRAVLEVRSKRRLEGRDGWREVTAKALYHLPTLLTTFCSSLRSSCRSSLPSSQHALRNYSCVTKGDVICIPYNNKNYYLELMDVKPQDAACIIETDCNVDFDTPVGYVEPDYKKIAEEKVKDTYKNMPRQTR